MSRAPPGGAAAGNKVREVVPAASSSAASPAQGPRSLLRRGTPKTCSFDSESPFTVGLSLFRSLLLCHPEQSPRNAAVGLSQGADSQGCCHAHRFVDLQTWGGQRCSQNLRPAGAGPGKGRGRARRGHPTADGRAHFQTTCTRHRVCPGHGFDPARGPGRLSPCTPRERGRSGTGSVGRPVCVGGRSTAIVTCASLSSAHPAAISPWPEASPRACAAPWGARRAQGVTRWGQRPAPLHLPVPRLQGQAPSPRGSCLGPSVVGGV